MQRILIYTLVAWIALVAQAGAAELQRRIAITFDDLPAGVVRETSEMREITNGILQVLSENRIPAMGFVNEIKLYREEIPDPERIDLLRRWLEAGLELGNHTYSHPDLHKISQEEFQADTIRGETITRGLVREAGSNLRFFRHPFLHTGMDLAVKERFEKFLADHGYRIAPVTVDNSEWIFNAAYLQANEEQRRAVGREYVHYMESMLGYYEDQSRKLFEREIPQVLLLHANSVNAEFLKDLVEMMKSRGYAFVSLEQALGDAAYELPDRFTGRSGISWIHRWAIAREVPQSFFQGEPVTPEWIEQLAGIQE